MSTTLPIESLAKLFENSVQDLTRYFERRQGSSDQAADLVQETFLLMTKKVEQGLPLDCARGYLFGIARNVCHKAWRAPKFEELNQDLPNPELDERTECAREVIAALPQLQREVLELRFTQSLSYQEIATALSIPVGTVRSRIHNAVAEVKQRLAQSNL
ncbi:MAG: sigma-70 family RNA polymerase sigma factor [Verrucomicrobiaceae bacterium]|nr:sigma-70 family RNA polymerase sigma factor [Verrucomicrobiaceae bacterium]